MLWGIWSDFLWMCWLPEAQQDHCEPYSWKSCGTRSWDHESPLDTQTKTLLWPDAEVDNVPGVTKKTRALFQCCHWWRGPSLGKRRWIRKKTLWVLGNHFPSTLWKARDIIITKMFCDVYRSLRRGDTKECLNIPSGIGWGGNDTGRLVTWEFPLRTDSASWKSLESFIQFTSFCSSCILPDNSEIVFWSSISFRLAIVSKVELWNFRNSSISARLCWWASRNSNFCCHICPCRSRRSSSAWAACSSRWLTFSRYSAIIVCRCSSSRVLICAFELFRSSGFPDPSTTFSVWVFSENLLWALYVFLVTPKPTDWSTFLSPSSFPDLSNTTDDDDRLTDMPSGSQ